MTPLTIIMYHYVRANSESCYPRIKGLEIESFKRQLDYLQKHYCVINVSQLVNCVKYETPLPLNPCLLTFDDGYKDHFNNVFPELLDRGIQGSFFPVASAVESRELLDVNKIHFILASYESDTVLLKRVENMCFEFGICERNWQKFKDVYFKPNRYDSPKINFIKNLLQHVLPENIRRDIRDHLFCEVVARDVREFADELYMSSDDVKELIDAGMYVGSHGYRHNWLNQLPIKKQEEDIESSIKFLSDIGAPIKDWIMCYPYGAYTPDTLEILKNRSCLFGLTTKVGISDIGIGKFLELPRLDTNDFPSK